MKKQELQIETIVLDHNVQSRTELNQTVIKDYAEDIQNGAEFPPVDVFYDGNKYWLADGFHRCKAAVEAGNETVDANVRDGSHRDAILFSVGVNAEHGLRRTNEDKRRVVKKLLTDEEWKEWSDGVIAQKCAVSQPFVSKTRRELTQNGSESTDQRKGADGRTIDTTGIGKEQTSKEQLSPEDGKDEAPDGVSPDQNDGQADVKATEVTVDLPPPEGEPDSGESPAASKDESQDENPEEGETDDDDQEDDEELSEKEIEASLSKVRDLIGDLMSKLGQVLKMLPKEGTLAQFNWRRLKKPVDELSGVWKRFNSNLRELIPVNGGDES